LLRTAHHFATPIFCRVAVTWYFCATSSYNNKRSAVAEMGDRGHNRQYMKIGGSCATSGGAGSLCFGGAGSPCNTMWPGSRPTLVPSGILIYPAVWPQQTWAENWEGAMPFFWGGAGSPSSAIWPWPRPTSIPSGILIHPAIWPQ